MISVDSHQCETVGLGWWWVQCSRGPAGMAFSFCPRSDL